MKIFFWKRKPTLATNFLLTEEEQEVQRKLYIKAALLSLGIAVVATIGASASYRAATRGTSVFFEVVSLPVIHDVRRMVFGVAGGSGDESLIPKDQRMNLLILGIGGEGHDGALLTDTIMLASIDLKNRRIGLLSIPRDLAYPLGGGRFEKINHVHFYAEKGHPGEGLRRTMEALSTLLDVRIDHVVRFDFQGFLDFVDAIGGVDVMVERSFTDAIFPTEDEKWKEVTFVKGLQHMDGTTALSFARSRHGNNGEGTDFARSRRQQFVILAVRKKLLTLGTLMDPKKLSAVYSAISLHMASDLNPWQLFRLATVATNHDVYQITMHTLTDEAGKELLPAMVGGAFMLFPRQPDWSEIRTLAQNPFEMSDVMALSTPAVAESILSKNLQQKKETTKLEVKNGTFRTGFAAQVAAKLERAGFEIVSFGNAAHRGFERSIVYDLTDGKKAADLSRLRKTLNAVVVVQPIPDETVTGTHRFLDRLNGEKLSGQVDFLVVLGEATYALVANGK